MKFWSLWFLQSITVDNTIWHLLISILASLREYQNNYHETVDGFHTITVPPPPPPQTNSSTGESNQPVDVPIENPKASR